MIAVDRMKGLAATLALALGVAEIDGLSMPRASAQVAGPKTGDEAGIRATMEIFQQKHLLKKDFDREMASRSVDALVQSLDPQKQFFLKSDIEEFNRGKAELADKLKEGDATLAYDIYRRYQTRVKETVKVWAELLKPDAVVDFTAKEVIVLDSKALEFPKDEKARHERWRLSVKRNLLAAKVDPDEKEFDLAKASGNLASYYARFARGVAETKSDAVLELFLTQVGGSYDRGTTYTSPSSVEDYETSQKGNFVGIGIQFQEDGTVSSIIPGGPAATDGRLKPKDRIVSVGEGEGELDGLKSISRLNQNEVIALIRGSAGTTVRLGIQRPGEAKLIVVSLRRGKVVIAQSVVEARIERAIEPNGAELKVGYIDVPNFYIDRANNDSTSIAVRKQLDDFSKKGAGAIVLDLRRCGGGATSEAVALAGLFVGPGIIFQSKDQSGAVEKYDNANGKMAWDKPLVVLIGKMTGSGAEIVCAAIQDYKRGLVVGDESTYGMGLIRNVLYVANFVPEANRVPNMGIVQVTTAQFYRVNGDGFQQRGVKADVVLPSLAGSRFRKQVDVDHFGFDRVPVISVDSQGMVNTETVLVLRSGSRTRQKSSEDFKKLQTLIEWELGRSVASVETLNEKEYRAKLQETPANDLPKTKPGESDFYLKEVLSVAADYTAALGHKKVVPPVIVIAPPVIDPEIAREATRRAAREAERQELSNKTESARQAVDQSENEVRIQNNKLLAAQAAWLLAKRAYDVADPGSGREFAAAIACGIAEQAYNELKRDLRRLEAELSANQSQYYRLRNQK